MGLSKNQLKLITSLKQKKYRNKYSLFIAEGIKVVKELLASEFEVEELFATENVKDFPLNKVNLIDDKELKKISSLKSPNKVLGLFKIPKESTINLKGLVVALDDVNDPGNLGTIIRLCDWFGVQQLICSKNTVDCFNPKVIQSTMGSITRVQINYVNLREFIGSAEIPIFSADMDGENVYETQLPDNGILVMGNEANGISTEINQLVNNKLTIPRFGETQETESLNVATATAILLSEFKRRLK